MSLRALVQVEANGLDDMRQALQKAAATAAALIDASDGTRTAIVDALQASCKTLDAELEVFILKLQRAASALAADVIVVELHRLDVDYTEVDDEEDPDDEARADSAASSLAAAFLAAGLAMLLLRPKPDLQKLVALHDYRLRRTSGTETFSAYSRAMDRYYDQLVETHPELHKRWDAMLDACPICRSLDGEIRPLDQDFTDGYEPGYVHIACRCVSTLLPS